MLKLTLSVPTNPQDLQIGDVGSSSVYLWWHSPEYSRGILQKYTVSFTIAFEQICYYICFV